MWVLILLTLVVAFAAVFFVSLLTPKISTATNINYTPTYDQAVAATDSSIVDIYCYSLPLSQFTNSTIYSVCSNSLRRYVLQWVLNASIGIAIVLINTILTSLVSLFASIKRFKSKTEEIKTKSLSLYIATLVNSIVLTVILQSDFWGQSPTRLTVDLLNTTSISSAINPLLLYTDYNRNWYVDVGTKITTFWIVALFSPHMINFLLLPLSRCCRGIKADKA